MDTSVGLDRIMKLQTHQRINHFSGMLEICRKNSMARNLMRMAARAPESYRFFPRRATAGGHAWARPPCLSPLALSARDPVFATHCCLTRYQQPRPTPFTPPNQYSPTPPHATPPE